jgi:serine/threonine protein kinase/DNA-directed RNA polymerase subunit RPC12/RpoP
LDAKAVFAPKTHHRDRPVPRDDRSISKEETYAGKVQQSDPVSLGDQGTFVNEPSQDSMVIGSTDLSQRYLIESTIGHGGMGEVHLATDTRLKRKVAIKRIKNQSTNNATLLRRFLTEAQSIAQLNHYHIVQVYDYGHDSQGPYLVLEYVDGGTLADKLKSGPMPIEDGIRIICQVCDGLSKAHAAGIIHRDIKPANILLTADGVPKLADFGLARVENFDSGHTMAGSVLGTLDFMSPEQRLDIKLTDERSDLWSLAATFYQMVTGRSPKIIRLDAVPIQLHQILNKALEDDPADRFQEAYEFSESLKKIRFGEKTTVIPQSESHVGKCAECQNVNDINRKFCKVCASSLRFQCLKCNKDIPVWDSICGECGGKQDVLIKEKEHEYDELLMVCDTLISKYDYEPCIEIVMKLEKLDKARFDKYLIIAKDIRARIHESREKINKLFEEALIYATQSNYKNAISTLEEIPLASLSDQFNNSLNEWKRKSEKLELLEKQINHAVERNQLFEALEKIDDALEIDINNTYMHKLKENVTRKKELELDSLLSEFEMAIERHDYDKSFLITDKLAGIKHPSFHKYQKMSVSFAELAKSHKKQYDQEIVKRMDAVHFKVFSLLNQEQYWEVTDYIGNIKHPIHEKTKILVRESEQKIYDPLNCTTSAGNITIEGTTNQEMSVEYSCDFCGAMLIASIDEIDKEFDCPECGKKVVTPGRDLLEIHLRNISEVIKKEGASSNIEKFGPYLTGVLIPIISLFLAIVIVYINNPFHHWFKF